MNFFGIGGAELVLIVLIMLIVAGPKRMIQWAYVLGVWVGKARLMWQQAVDVLQKEMDEAGVHVQLPKEPPTRQSIARMVNEAVKPYTQELEAAYYQPQQTAASSSPKPTPPANQPAAPSLGAWEHPQPPAAPTPNLGSWEAKQTEEHSS